VYSKERSRTGLASAHAFERKHYPSSKAIPHLWKSTRQQSGAFSCFILNSKIAKYSTEEFELQRRLKSNTVKENFN
jgi:hypothetical protein